MVSLTKIIGLVLLYQNLAMNLQRNFYSRFAMENVDLKVQIIDIFNETMIITECEVKIISTYMVYIVT